MSAAPIMPERNQIWRHYKGGEYLVLRIVDEGDDEIPPPGNKRVHYMNVETHKTWDISLARWLSRLPDGRLRYELVVEGVIV